MQKEGKRERHKKEENTKNEKTNRIAKSSNKSYDDDDASLSHSFFLLHFDIFSISNVYSQIYF